MIRVAMTLPKKLVNEFDECAKKNGYTSRRKGLQHALEKYINENK